MDKQGKERKRERYDFYEIKREMKHNDGDGANIYFFVSILMKEITVHVIWSNCNNTLRYD